MKIIKEGVCVLVACWLLSGCAAPPATEKSEAMSAGFHVENLRGEATGTFAVGTSVRLVFEIANPSASTTRYSFTFPPHRATVKRAKGGDVAWEAWQGQMFPQVMRTQVLDPGETRTFSIEWPTAGAAPGQYLVIPRFQVFVEDRQLLKLPQTVVPIELIEKDRRQ